MRPGDRAALRRLGASPASIAGAAVRSTKGRVVRPPDGPRPRKSPPPRPEPLTPSVHPGPPLQLVLPEPPSANRWWRHVGGRVLLSREAREYKRAVLALLTAAGVRPIPAPRAVSITVNWHRGRKSGDLDKRLGVLLDALQGTAYDSDSQITRIGATRHEWPGNARVVVHVEAIVSPAPPRP